MCSPLLPGQAAARLLQLLPACYDSSECKASFQAVFGPCPGKYCGRATAEQRFETGGVSLAVVSEECGRCPRGQWSDHYACLPCSEGLSLYGILFLIYLVIISVVINILAVVSTSQGSDRRLLLISCTIEAAVSAIATLLLLSPVGRLSLSSCPTVVYQSWASDWHPWLYNPPGRNCASEVVYPLYSAPLLFYGFSIASLLLLRLPLPLHSSRYLPPSLLSSLFAVPVQAAVQSGIGSVHFLFFPGIVLVLGLVVDVLVAYKGVRKYLGSALRITGFLALRVVWSAHAVAALLDATQRPLTLLPISVIVPIIPISELACSLFLDWRRGALHVRPRRAPASDPDPVHTSGPVYVGESPVPESQTRLRSMAGSVPRDTTRSV